MENPGGEKGGIGRVDAVRVEAACVESAFNVHSEEIVVYNSCCIPRDSIQLGGVCSFAYSWRIRSKEEDGEDSGVVVLQLRLGSCEVPVEAASKGIGKEEIGEGAKYGEGRGNSPTGR